MTVTLANEIRPTHMPAYCSACHNQNPEKRHVDFDAACDRGYSDGVAVAVNYDDLILCEDCLKSGARLVEMEDASTLKAQIESLEVRLDAEERLRRQAQTYAENMEAALASRTDRKGPAAVEIDHRKKPRENLRIGEVRA